MIPVFLTGGASYNAVITLENFPGMSPKTIHECDYHETIGNTGVGDAFFPDFFMGFIKITVLKNVWKWQPLLLG